MKSEIRQRITIIPGLCGGRPTIRGMRIRVTDVLELLSEGLSTEEILAHYPDLVREDVVACILFASHHIDHPILTV